MKREKTFVTIFTAAENFHLVKDVGQIPYFMYKTEGYNSTIVSYKNNNEYPYLRNEVKGLNLLFIRDVGRLFHFEIGVFKYLFSSSKAIDVLNLFHFKKDNLVYLLIYRWLNPRGKSIIKLDLDLFFFRNYNALFYSKYRLKNFFLKKITRWIFNLTDVISIETEDAKTYLLKVYPELNGKLICIPNGVDNLYIENSVSLKTFEEKENIIITAGRIGTNQKNTELLLEALAITDLNDWKMYIIGPIEETFIPYIDQYFNKFPLLRERVIFTGNITDRSELFEWYNRAKIFCLTSRWEGFSIVLPEALYFGNYLVTTNISCANYVTENEKHGTIVESTISELSNAIQKCTAPGFLSAQRYKKTKDFSQNHLIWPQIIKTLSARIKEDA